MTILLHNERGLALVVALMLLILLTVMGLAAISTTTTEIQLTANERTDAQAFHSAEAGIKEVLYRSTLVQLGTTTIQNGGSYTTVDGTTFDAVISDPATPPDPDWRYNIYFTTPPASSGSTTNTRTILSANDQSTLAYSTADVPVAIRYLKESDLCDWGISPCDLNNVNGDPVLGDGDLLDLVYFNGNTAAPARLGAGVKSGGADSTPPTGINQNLAIRLITVTGHGGNATKRIQLETAGFPVDPKATGAVMANIPLEITGSGFVSGYNHSETTTPNDKNNINTNLYNNNGCNNYSEAAGNGACSINPDPESNCPDNKPCTAEYSGKAEATGHKPAVVSTGLDNQGNPVDVKKLGGKVEAWGGNDDNTAGWKAMDPSAVFPTLAQLLGVDQTTMDSVLDNANTNPDACPSGVTYIDNANTKQVYSPSGTCQNGSGILIVTGDLKVTAQFEFRGLIYVEGKAEFRGDTWLLGAVAVKGIIEGEPIKKDKIGGGGATMLYSKKTVEGAVTAAMTQAGSAFTTLSWREY